MRFESVKELKGEAFRRLTGVQRSTFEEMAAVLFTAKCKQKAAGGRPNTLSSERVSCENVIAMLKRFKIIADRYRNRRRRFGLRFFLIAAIYNMELDLA